MGIEQRKHSRVKGYAKVLFAKTITPGYIRDLSGTGCQVSFVQAIPVDLKEVIELEVMEGDGPHNAPFSLKLRVCWTRTDGIYFSLGGDIVETASMTEGGPFARLVAYYQGES